MTTIRIDFDAEALKALDRRVRLLTDQNLRFVAARALTESAKAAQSGLKQAMPRFIDQPTRWTLGSTFVQYARANNLETTIGIRSDKQGRGNAAGRYLRPIVEGTTPKIKGADLSATKIAGVSSGAVLVPARTSGLKNAAGNVPLSKYATIFGEARKANGRYYLAPVKRGSSTMAVFERKEGFIGRTSTIERTVRRMFTIESNPKTRRPVFPVQEILSQAFGQAWPIEVRRAFTAEVAGKLGPR